MTKQQHFRLMVDMGLLLQPFAMHCVDKLERYSIKHRLDP